MVASLNMVQLMGRLGKDPQCSSLGDGTRLARFSIATTESYKDRTGTKVDKTEWHNLVLWRGLAEVAEKYLKKGSLIYIKGKLNTRKYEKDGITHYTTEIVVEDLKIISGGNDSQSVNNQQHSEENTASQVNSEDDLPF